jgi:hypothetical protein
MGVSLADFDTYCRMGETHQPAQKLRSPHLTGPPNSWKQGSRRPRPTTPSLRSIGGASAPTIHSSGWESSHYCLSQ